MRAAFKYVKFNKEIEIDCERDHVKLLIEATVRLLPCLIRLGDLLEVVSHCSSIRGAPSWTLNPTGGGHIWGLQHFFGAWNADVWNATHSYFPLLYHCFKLETFYVSDDMKSLFVKGIIVDRVAIVSETFPRYLLATQATWHRTVRELLLQWQECIQKSLEISFEESLIDILFSSEVIKEHPVFTIVDTVWPERDKIKDKEARISALCNWFQDSDTNYRLDETEILNSVHTDGYCDPEIHSPALSGRYLFVTTQGKMALGKTLQRGDAVALLSGCVVSYALRSALQDHGESFTLGQPVLLPGVMFGEAWPKDKDGDLKYIRIM